jgi:D-arabinose 1-dehydrogenase-like Zn-dependent alcohol dehydrogenase
MREIRMQGLLVGPRTAYEALVRFLEAHALRPVIDSEFSLERFREAFQRLESDEHFGKICLTI